MPTPEAYFSNFKDYYSILGFDGIDPNKVSTSMIKRNYDYLVRTNYPDHFTDPNSEIACLNRRVELDEARNVLGDENKKGKYDELYKGYQQQRAGKERSFYEEYEHMPAVLRELFTLFTKAKREGKRVINIEELNRKTLDELIAIEGLVSEYAGKMKESFRPQLNEFSKTILNKRAYHPGLWKFILGIRTRNYSEIANHSSLSAKYEWEIYKQIFPTGYDFEEKVDLAFHKIEEDYNRNPRARSGTIIGFNEMLDKMTK